MASGSFSVSTSNGYISGYVAWSSTADIASNTSSVYAEMRLSRTNSGYTTWGTGEFHLNINGTDISSGSKSFTITQNSNTLMVSGTVGVAHNADGTKAIAIGWSGSIPGAGLTVNSSSGTAYLDTIPRASNYSGTTSWIAGVENLTYTVSSASGSFTHNIEVRVQKPDGTWIYCASHAANIGSGTFTFTTTDNTNIYNAISQYENRPSWIRLITYNGGTLIGYKDYYGTVYGQTPGTISFNNFNIGTTSVPATIANWNANFVYTLTLTFGSLTKTYSNVQASTNLTFTTADINTMYASIPNANSGTGNVFVSTKYNGVEINDGNPVNQNKSFTATVVNSPPIFGSSWTYKDNNSTTATATGNNQYMVQAKSQLLVTILTTDKATAQNSATMVSYEATIAGKTVTASWSSTATVTIDLGTIDASSAQTLQVSAIDSRGNRTPITKSVSFLPYSPVSIRATGGRLNNFEDQTTINISGTASDLAISASPKNSIVSATYKYKKTTDASYGSATALTITGLASWSAAAVVLTLNKLYAWTIEITIQDEIQSTTKTVDIGTGQPIFFIDDVKKSIGVNQFPANNGTFESNGDIYEGGTRLLDKYLPAGIIQLFAGTTFPAGWLVCRGQAISRTAYARLYGIIGTTYGTGDGSTTFNLPDLQGRIPVGLDSAQTEFNVKGKTGGEKTHILSVTEMPSHSHDIKGGGSYISLVGGSGNYRFPWYSDGGLCQLVNVNTGGGGAHNNLQPYITLNYIIKT